MESLANAMEKLIRRVLVQSGKCQNVANLCIVGELKIRMVQNVVNQHA